jgi:signal peptidase I
VEERRSPGSGILGWLKTLSLTVALALAARAVVVEAYVVPSGSMRPTIEVGDHLLGSKFHYRFWSPARGDIVVFRPPEAAQQEGAPAAPRYVKRVIAVAGDEVSVRGGRVWVNGEPVIEPYLAEAPGYAFGPRRVPEGHLFVLGDNRNESLDSHRWGFLSEDALIAHVFGRYWPPRRIGGLP